MTKSDYVPNGEGDFLKWHDQMLKEAQKNGMADGLTAEEVAQLESDNAAIHAAARESEELMAASQRANAAKRALFKTVESNARGVAASLKGAPHYQEAKGKGYGIVGQLNSMDLANTAPVLTGDALPHGAALLGYERGEADGINLYCARGSGPMELVRFVGKTQVIDRRPLLVPNAPELRVYEAIFVKDDEEIGRRSAAISVACHM